MNAGFTYNRAKSSWDWDFTERAQMFPENNLTTPLAETGIEAAGEYGSVNYDTWEMNNLVDEYSDLAYQQYQFTLGGTYEFTDAFYTSASATYDIFRSKEGYVYGDEDGKAYYAYLGFGYRF